MEKMTTKNLCLVPFMKAGRFLLVFMMLGIAFNGFSQNRQKAGTPMPIPETKTGILETPKMIQGNKSVATPQYGTALGTTYYDYHTNGCMQERIYVDAGGNVRMVWTQGLDTTGGAFPDRGVGYAYYDADSMTFSNGDSAGTVGGLAPSRVGWPTIAPKEGSEVAAAHALVILKNPTPGQTAWTARTPSEITGGTLFPHFSYSESNSTLHMIYSNTGRTGFLYAKSTTDGDTFEVVDVDIAANFGLDQKVTFNDLRDDVADIVTKGDTVVIGAGGFGSDYYIFKSYDNGNTWSDTIMVAAIDTVGAPGDQASGYQVFGPDNTARIGIDNNGMVHMVAGLSANLINSDLTQAGSYYPEVRGIFYWNESMGTNINVNDSLQYDQYVIIDSIYDSFQPNGSYVSGTDFVGLYVSGLFSHPSILFNDNNDAFIVFSAPPAGAADASSTVDGYQRRDLYVMRKNDGAMTWSAPNNIAGLAGAGDGLTEGTSFYEESYPVTPRRVHNGMIHVLHQVGFTPGSAIIDAKFGFEEEKSLAHYAFSTSLVGNVNPAQKAKVDNFRVYPNPAMDVINLELTRNIDEANITITNSIGQVVRNITLNSVSNRSLTFDVSDLENGMYFVSVNDGTSQTTKRVVVQ